MSTTAGSGGERGLPRDDRGAGSLNHYRYNLLPKSRRVKIRLADSNPHQAELAGLAGESPLETATGRRSAEQDRVDAPIEVRLFAQSRVTGVVGVVPRGLESVVDQALARLEESGLRPRIPVTIVKTRGGLRVDLLLGETG